MTFECLCKVYSNKYEIIGLVNLFAKPIIYIESIIKEKVYLFVMEIGLQACYN